jgi:hypothetical protein
MFQDHCIIAKAVLCVCTGLADATSTMACRNGTADASFVQLFSVGYSLLSPVCSAVSLAESPLSVNNLFPTITDVLGPRVKRATLSCRTHVHAL